MKKLLLGLGSLAGIVVIFGVWYFVETYDRSELPEWLGGEPQYVDSGDTGRVWSRFVAVTELSDQDFERWPGTLECDPWERWDGFSRDKTLWVSDNMVAYDNGDVAAFLEAAGDGTAIPAELSARFEWWRGDVQGTEVVMEGWYTAVTDELKRLQMTGRLIDGALLLEGTRGPRECRIEANRPQ
ncbi:hypothetical protein [Marinimicrobium locisalis]|uniref:hypothetical protein n=1 Tax=Marinimicrobium locisalis TaxID=546022 RepID=UPI00322152FF